MLTAQNTLGSMYEQGKGVDQDYNQAFYWFTAAAEQGHANAQINLADMYARGQGTNQDYKKAFNLIKNITPKNDEEKKAIQNIKNTFGIAEEKEKQKKRKRRYKRQKV